MTDVMVLTDETDTFTAFDGRFEDEEDVAEWEGETEEWEDEEEDEDEWDEDEWDEDEEEWEEEDVWGDTDDEDE